MNNTYCWSSLISFNVINKNRENHLNQYNPEQRQKLAGITIISIILSKTSYFFLLCSGLAGTR
jgi:hypothetical protein